MEKNIDRELIQIGEQIRILRKRRGMGQQELANAAKVSCMTISRIENGTTAMNVLTLKKLAEVLEVNIGKILD